MAAKKCPICQEVVEQEVEGVTKCTKCGHPFRPSDPNA